MSLELMIAISTPEFLFLVAHFLVEKSISAKDSRFILANGQA
jgi:hypothetical protein